MNLTIVNQIKLEIMKTRNYTLRWLIMLLLIVNAVAAKAQPYPESGAQIVCISGIAEPYGVINTVGSSYLWTVNGATTSLDWVLTSAGTNLATILWITPGNYTVQVLETNTAGCSNPLPVEVSVTVDPLPTATIEGTIAVCEDGTPPDVTFTGADGTAPYTFTYTINGGPDLTVISTGIIATVAAPTTVSGEFTYNLVSVQDASATACSQTQTGSAVITVNPLPTATIDGTIAVCEDGTSPDVTFTGADGTAPYTFTYTINGGTDLTVISVGDVAIVPAPTNVSGEFIYALVSVKDASSTNCSQAQTGSAVITVNPLPTATIAGTIDECLNEPSPDVTFTGADGTAPYTFTYTINGGSDLTVISTGDIAIVPAPTTVAGEFTYVLLSVKDASGTTCSQAQAGSVIITIEALPITSTIYHN